MGFMLCGAYFFGYVIGSITNTVSIRNHAQNFFYETMDKLQAFVEVRRRRPSTPCDKRLTSCSETPPPPTHLPPMLFPLSSAAFAGAPS